MLQKCRACGCEGESEGDQQAGAPGLPAGWFSRCIDDVDYVLCDVCGSVGHFRGGVSAYLLDTLQLDEGARCDVSAEVAMAREQRLTVRRDRSGR